MDCRAQHLGGVGESQEYVYDGNHLEQGRWQGRQGVIGDSYMEFAGIL